MGHGSWVMGRGIAATLVLALCAAACGITRDDFVTAARQVRSGRGVLVAHPWSLLTADSMKSPGFKPWRYDGGSFTSIDRQRRVVPLDVAINGRKGTWFLYAEVQSEDAQTLRFECNTPGTRSWIGGEPVAT